jgi:hypothetical protein
MFNNFTDVKTLMGLLAVASGIGLIITWEMPFYREAHGKSDWTIKPYLLTLFLLSVVVFLFKFK